jgi:hypothetical protein
LLPQQSVEGKQEHLSGEQFYAWKGWASFAVTRRYLGVAQDDQDEVYRRLAEVV